MAAEQQSFFDNPLIQARQLKIQRRFQEAERVLQAALARDPEERKLRASLADLYFRTDRHKEAMALAGTILREDPDDPRALVVLGNCLLERHQPREALEYFRLALAVAPTDYLYVRIARCHLDRKEPQAALEAIEAGERLASPDSTRLLQLRVEAARLLGDAGAERAVLRRASGAAPAEPAGFFQFVYPLIEDLPPRRAAAAAARLRETVGQERNPHLLLFEAEALRRSRDPTTACERLRSLLEQPVADGVRQAAEELLAEIDSEARG